MRRTPPKWHKGGDIMSNTRQVVIHKNNQQAAPFVSLSVNTIVNTYKKLQDAEAFYLYLYLCGNRDGFSASFSSESLALKCGQRASLIEENFDKLLKAGYLVQQEQNKNVYDFYASTEPTQPKMIYWG
jgi:hypothetical protein